MNPLATLIAGIVLGAGIVWLYWEHLVTRACSTEADQDISEMAMMVRQKIGDAFAKLKASALLKHAEGTPMPDDFKNPEPSGKLCECDGNRPVCEIGHWDGCPLDGGGHTNFVVHRCGICGGVFGFPSSNFALALKYGTVDAKVTLLAIIGSKESITDEKTEGHTQPGC